MTGVRTPGIYLVRGPGDTAWTVASWDGYCWLTFGDEVERQDRWFDEIGAGPLRLARRDAEGAVTLLFDRVLPPDVLAD